MFSMPELPEVETTIRGIIPHLEQNIINEFIVRQAKLRWPIPSDINAKSIGNCVNKITRRGKYIIFELQNGAIIMHLGMSGRVKVLNKFIEPEKHDHVDINFKTGVILRYTDPRRFGSILWVSGNPLDHPLLKKLGPEPLEQDFTAEYLFAVAKNRNLPIKSLIMDSKVVVGVGNIYATEALFTSKIHPLTPAKLVSKSQFEILVLEIKKTLQLAINAGGTTLKDFLGSDGKPGYFVQKLKVYGKSGSACIDCQTTLESLQIGQRTTTFCPGCQIHC